MGEQEEARSDIGVIGYVSHNARVVQIKRFCTLPPRGAAMLRLQVAGTDGEVLCSYLKDDCEKDKGATIPEAISLTLEEHVATVEQEVQAVLAWVREDGESIITTKRLRARPLRGVVNTPGMTLAESAALVGQGDSAAVVCQTIRSNEIFLRSYIQGHHSQLQQQRELSEVSLEQAKMSGALAMQMYEKQMEMMGKHASLLEANLRLQAELDAANKQIAALTEALEGPAETDAAMPETDAAKAALVKSVGDQLNVALPEAWQLFKIWAVQQAGKNAAANANGKVNGHVHVNVES